DEAADAALLEQEAREEASQQEERRHPEGAQHIARHPELVRRAGVVDDPERWPRQVGDGGVKEDAEQQRPAPHRIERVEARAVFHCSHDLSPPWVGGFPTVQARHSSTSLFCKLVYHGFPVYGIMIPLS